MSNDPLKIGDVVQLKSGGLKMTVIGIVTTGSDTQVRCVYTEIGEMFDGVRPQRIDERVFPGDVLRVCEPQ